jgi:hypothetical protein
MATHCKSDSATWLRFQAVAIVVGLPALLLALSLLSLEQLESMPGLCVWKRLTGSPCPGCGTTHALWSVAHGDFAAAPRYNRNVYVLVPVVLWIWAAQVRVLWKRNKTDRRLAATS